jgi:8-oxo-dGTP pyrophosphatase MutT (NUDIX family)
MLPLADALTHPLVARLAASLAAREPRLADVAHVEPAPRRAAVAVILRVDAEQEEPAVDVLFIKRAEYEGDPWSGHVAFPGGRHEPGDASPWHTAARETLEEIGLDLHTDGRLLGALDEVFPRSQRLPSMVVRPYVAIASPARALVLSDEVAAAFWVPVRRLTAPDANVTSTVRAHGLELRVPSFVHDGHTIWGMTERVLRQLLDHLG